MEGGAHDNESYGGISIKTQKANMRQSEFLMLEELKSAPHLNDKKEGRKRGGGGEGKKGREKKMREKER